jgi:hypothetical protein
MKYIIALLVCLTLTSCKSNLKESKMPFDGSGEYKNLMLPCNCGGIIVYEPDSCPCFTKNDYPDLVESLNKTHNWFKEHTRLKTATKYKMNRTGKKISNNICGNW